MPHAKFILFINVKTDHIISLYFFMTSRCNVFLVFTFVSNFCGSPSLFVRVIHIMTTPFLSELSTKFFFHALPPNVCSIRCTTPIFHCFLEGFNKFTMVSVLMYCTHSMGHFLDTNSCKLNELLTILMIALWVQTNCRCLNCSGKYKP